MMSVLVCVILGGASRLTQADGQCKNVSSDMANKASSIMRRGAQFVVYCQPCGDKSAGAWRTVDEIAVVGGGSSPRQIKINGAVTDLAYVYYQTSLGTASNLGNDVGCAARGVSQTLSFRPTIAKARYTLTIRIQIAATDNGGDWDAVDGSPPDPVFALQLYQSGQPVSKVACASQKDTFVATCVVTLDADDQTAIGGQLRDRDAVEDDDIGAIATPLGPAIKALNRAVAMRGVEGQIGSATVTLTRAP